MQGPSKQELTTKTIGELREKYPDFDGVYFELKDEDNDKIGKKYLSEFGAKGDEFIIVSCLFGSSKQKGKKSDKEVDRKEKNVISCEIDLRCCPDCKRTDENGADFYKKGRSGIVYLNCVGELDVEDIIRKEEIK